MCDLLDGVIEEVLCDAVTLKQGLEGGEGEEADVWRKSFPGKGAARNRASEWQQVILACLENRKSLTECPHSWSSSSASPWA